MNNFFRYDYFFAKRVEKYFGLTNAGTTVEIKTIFDNKKKKRIYFTGKFSLSKLFILFLLSSLFVFINAYSNYVIFKFVFLLFGLEINNYKYFLAIAIIVALIACICVYFKNLRKKHFDKLTNISMYERDLPSKLRPAHVRFLLKEGLVDEVTLAATLIDLVDRGYLKLKYDNESNLKFNLFKNKEIIIEKTDKNFNDLFQYEIYLIEWFLGYNNGYSITQNMLHRGLVDDIRNDDISPSDKMKHFQALVLMSFPVELYFDEIKSKGEAEKQTFKYVFFMFLGFIFPFFYIGEFLGIYGIGCLITSSSYLLNQRGVNEILRWQNFKRYLLQLSDIKSKNSEEIIIWNFYLTYSIALEISGIAFEELKNFFGTKIFDSIYEERKEVVDISELDKYKLELEEWNKNFELERKKELSKYEC